MSTTEELLDLYGCATLDPEVSQDTRFLEWLEELIEYAEAEDE